MWPDWVGERGEDSVFVAVDVDLARAREQNWKGRRVVVYLRLESTSNCDEEVFVPPCPVIDVEFVG